MCGEEEEASVSVLVGMLVQAGSNGAVGVKCECGVAVSVFPFRGPCGVGHSPSQPGSFLF